MAQRALAQFSPGRLILLALFATIAVGALLLALPLARTVPMAPIDIIFTSTSVTCVTGLFTVPIEHFTFFGHCVILVLMQIGGLGLITLMLFVWSLLSNMGLATQLMAGQLLEIESWKNIKKIIIFIISVTTIIEACGALVLYFVQPVAQLPVHRLFCALFHSVSAFCSTGISIFGNNLVGFANHGSFLLITALLMLIGGLGFITIYELLYHWASVRAHKRHHLSLQCRLVLAGTLAAILTGTVLIWMLEHENSFAPLGAMSTVINSVFHAISCRSTGFITVNVTEFQLATLFLFMVISFIGSAPGSTGSGIKLTTLAVYIATVKAAITGTQSVNIGSRQIAKEQVNKAIAIVALSFLWIILTTFCLLITEARFTFLDIFFESVTAFSNLGLSTGITGHLTTMGKLFIMFSMIAGRIGSLTLILALRKIALRRTAQQTQEFSYPQERIMLS